MSSIKLHSFILSASRKETWFETSERESKHHSFSSIINGPSYVATVASLLVETGLFRVVACRVIVLIADCNVLL